MSIRANKKIKQESGVERRAQFMDLAMQLSKMAQKEDLDLAPFSSPELPIFSNLSEFEQLDVLKQFRSLVVICHQLQQRGGKIRSVKSLTWAFLKHFGCTGPSNLIDYLHDGDLVNAYGAGHRMLFASFTFFEVFSYSLEEFYCRPWMSLFERDNPQAQTALVRLATEMLDGKHERVTSMRSIPDHLCSEANSAKRVSVWLQSQFCAPIFYRGEVMGYLGTHHYTPVSTAVGLHANLSLS